MAIKRKMGISVNLTDGARLIFEGDQAQAVIQQIEKRQHGQEVNKQLLYIDDEGNKSGTEWRCICGYTQHPTTEEEVPDRQCDPMDCIEPIVRPANPSNVNAAATSDGATITADAVADAQLIVLKNRAEIAFGAPGVGEVSITGLLSGANVAEGDYKLIWRGPVRESYKVDVPSFTVA